VERRIKEGKKPLIFLTDKVFKVTNSVLEQWFAMRHQWLRENLARNDTADELEPVWAFHGTRPDVIPLICQNGLLRVGHPLNPSRSTDEGWFGDPHFGIYVSKYLEYTLQYCNAQGCPCPVDENQLVRVIMLKVLPGKSCHIPKVNAGMHPTAGFDSHTSPNYIEWYLFDETQACPAYIIDVRAVCNVRTSPNDGDCM
jgi:hypothetical protein